MGHDDPISEVSVTGTTLFFTIHPLGQERTARAVVNIAETISSRRLVADFQRLTRMATSRINETLLEMQRVGADDDWDVLVIRDDDDA